MRTNIRRSRRGSSHSDRHEQIDVVPSSFMSVCFCALAITTQCSNAKSQPQ